MPNAVAFLDVVDAWGESSDPPPRSTSRPHCPPAADSFSHPGFINHRSFACIVGLSARRAVAWDLHRVLERIAFRPSMRIDHPIFITNSTHPFVLPRPPHPIHVAKCRLREPPRSEKGTTSPTRPAAVVGKSRTTFRRRHARAAVIPPRR